MQRKERIWQVISFGLILLGLFVLLRFILLPTINSPAFQQFTESLGIFGYLIIIGYVVISHVFAPVAGTPGVALGVTIYGLETGMWLLYLGSLISATINFGIAKRFGRPWVSKLVGKQSMEKVDEFASVDGKQALVISRLLGFAFFDFISYAAGLTNLNYKNFILITGIFSLLPNLVIQYVFKDLNFQSEEGILVWIGSIVVAGILFGFLIKRYLDKNSRVTRN